MFEAILILTGFLFVFFSLFIAYYLLLLLFLSFKKSDIFPDRLTSIHKRIAIIIPAFNEELTIARTIESCQRLNYPRQFFNIIVIADNCTDHTAVVARQKGAQVLERNDKTALGKDHALRWAFRELKLQNYDAVMILDADCRINEEALSYINAQLSMGRKAIQLNNRISNPDDNPLTYILAVGNYIENNLFYSPKSKSNLAVFLRGTGMILSTELLEEYPWDEKSVAEDTAYSIKLLSSNIPIYFIDEVSVSSPCPISHKQLRTQRERWAGGNLNLGKKYTLKLLGKGFRKRSLLLTDAAWTLIINSKPLFIGFQFFALLIAGLLHISLPNSFSPYLLIMASAALVITALYFISGIIKMGFSKKRALFILRSPVWMFTLFRITFRKVFFNSTNTWEKTPRSSE
jgi:cellulose synthase/poly-beta-1,6-N-acetylglucosamine synthase-like glycosyltransferase